MPDTNITGPLWGYEQRSRRLGGLWPTNATVAPLVIGQAYAGGYYAGQISTAGNGVADYNLVVGPKSSSQTDAAWKTSGTTTSGTSSVIDGPTNSAAMNNASHPAAQFCEAVTAGGFTDWYMPAKNELEICYYNLKSSTVANSGSGINPNAVPARASNYGASPVQVSAEIFQSPSGTEHFNTTMYQSSTEFSATQKWGQNWASGGSQYGRNKVYSDLTRAVRRVSV